MKAIETHRSRVVYSDDAFAELVLWKLPRAVIGSAHQFKYRLAYVVASQCVVRYDNESGKGDHRHFDDQKLDYEFTTLDRLVADFQRDIARWNRENSRS